MARESRGRVFNDDRRGDFPEATVSPERLAEGCLDEIGALLRKLGAIQADGIDSHDDTEIETNRHREADQVRIPGSLG
jgi:hypothetical protein